jgi:hypothetical protein
MRLASLRGIFSRTRIVVRWFVDVGLMGCNDVRIVGKFQHFEGTYCLHYHEQFLSRAYWHIRTTLTEYAFLYVMLTVCNHTGRYIIKNVYCRRERHIGEPSVEKSVSCFKHKLVHCAFLKSDNCSVETPCACKLPLLKETAITTAV